MDRVNAVDLFGKHLTGQGRWYEAIGNIYPKHNGRVDSQADVVDGLAIEPRQLRTPRIAGAALSG